MGFLKRQNQALKKIEEEKIKNFLDDINEVCRKHKLALVPIIGKYGANFEVQPLKEETAEPELKVEKVENGNEEKIEPSASSS